MRINGNYTLRWYNFLKYIKCSCVCKKPNLRNVLTDFYKILYAYSVDQRVGHELFLNLEVIYMAEQRLLSQLDNV